MADKRDYYEVLGVDRGADDSTIKSAYRKLAKKYHPDLNAGDNRYEERLKDINEAYKNLSDANTRRKYDRMWYSRIGRKKKKDTKQQEAKKTATRSEILNVLFGLDHNNDEKEPAKQRKSMEREQVP